MPSESPFSENEPNVRNEFQSRRGFLRLAGMAGASLLLGLPKEAGALPALANPLESCQALGIPAEWMEKLGRSAASYAVYLSKLDLKHITVAQVIKSHLKVRDGVQNQIPPRLLWPNIKETLKVADRLAGRLGEPLEEVISAYRCPAYNARCPGGKKNSMHLKNNATDLRFRSSPRIVAKVARELRSEKVFRGGVGLYPDFTHVDTRGHNADW